MQKENFLKKKIYLLPIFAVIRILFAGMSIYASQVAAIDIDDSENILKSFTGTGVYKCGEAASLQYEIADGKSLKGWIKKQGDTYSVVQSENELANFIVTENTTFIPNTDYNITFDLNGGSGVEDRIYDMTTESFTLGTPTYDEHTFLGWTGSNGTVPQKNITINKFSKGNLYYKANWQDIENEKVSIWFYEEKEYPASVEYITKGKKVNRPQDPIRDNKTFINWYEDENCTNLYDFNSPVNEDLSLYAKWRQDSYTVSFINPIGQNLPDQTVANGAKVTRPADPEITGYVFKNWYTDNANTHIYDFNSEVNSDFALYAGWELQKYTLSFDTKGGNEIPSRQVEYNRLPGVNERPEKDNYNFIGWFTSDTCEEETRYSTELPMTGDMILYAGWEPATKVVTFDSNGGSYVAKQFIGYKETAQIPATEPVKSGYSFANWYKDAETTDEYNFNTPVEEDITLYAGWESDIYSVTFDSNGGSAVPPQSISYLKPAKQPEDPVKEGCIFKGWYSDSGFENKFDFITPITTNTTLYAKWEAQKFTVKFNTNGGNIIPSQTIQYNSSATKPTDPVRTNYVFTKWYKERSLTTEYDFTTPVKENMTLYAGWRNEKYTVSFNTNGGTGIDDVKVTYNTPLTEPTAPRRSGYTFGGWFVDAGLLHEYDFATPVVENITLNAKWTIETRNVTFNSMGGKFSNDETSLVVPVEYNSTVSRPSEEPTREGKDFKGWYSDVNATVPFDFNTKITKATTVRAGWKDTYYTVKFVTNGGSAVADQSVKYNTRATEPATTRTGYEFVHWYKDKALTQVYDFDLAVTKNLTLYAKWDADDLNVRYVAHGISDDKFIYPDSVDDVYPVDYSKSTIAFKWINNTTENYTKTAGTEDVYFVLSSTDNDGKKNMQLTAVSVAPFTLNNTLEGNLQAVTRMGDTIYYYRETRQDDAGQIDSSTGYYVFDGSAEQQLEFVTNDIAELVIFGDVKTNIHSQTVEYGEKLTKPESPVKSGYTFLAWYTDKDLTQEYDFGQIVTSDLTLYAQWGNNPHKVSFNTNGGSSIADVYVENNKKLTKPADPEKYGYTFGKWYSNEALSAEYDFDKAVTNNFTLYASWSIGSFTVSFDTMGGSEISPRTVQYMGTLSSLPVAVKTGHKFDKWYTDEELTQPFNASTPITEDITLYAGYTINEYEIKFVYAHQGMNEHTDTNPVVVKTVRAKYGSYLEVPSEIPERYHSVFNGWGYDFNQPVTQPVLIWAKWNPYQCTLVFEHGDYPHKMSADGTPLQSRTDSIFQGSMDNRVITSDDTYYLSNETLGYSLEGYEFAGWNSEPDGSGEDYPLIRSWTDGSGTHHTAPQQYTFDDFTDTNNDTAYLYAQWKPKKYNVRYIAYFPENLEGYMYGNDGEICTRLYEYDKELVTEDTKKESQYYVMTGWNTKQDGTGISYPLSRSIASLDLSEVQPYTIDSSRSGIINLYTEWGPYELPVEFYPYYYEDGQIKRLENIEPQTLRAGSNIEKPVINDVTYGYTAKWQYLHQYKDEYHTEVSENYQDYDFEKIWTVREMQYQLQGAAGDGVIRNTTVTLYPELVLKNFTVTIDPNGFNAQFETRKLEAQYKSDLHYTLLQIKDSKGNGAESWDMYEFHRVNDHEDYLHIIENDEGERAFILGWYLDPECTQEVEKPTYVIDNQITGAGHFEHGTQVMGDMTIYPKWEGLISYNFPEERAHDILYSLTSQSPEYDEIVSQFTKNSTMTSQNTYPLNYLIGETVQIPDAVKPMYTFKGWTVEKLNNGKWVKWKSGSDIPQKGITIPATPFDGYLRFTPHYEHSSGNTMKYQFNDFNNSGLLHVGSYDFLDAGDIKSTINHAFEEFKQVGAPYSNEKWYKTMYTNTTRNRIINKIMDFCNETAEDGDYVNITIAHESYDFDTTVPDYVHYRKVPLTITVTKMGSSSNGEEIYEKCMSFTPKNRTKQTGLLGNVYWEGDFSLPNNQTQNTAIILEIDLDGNISVSPIDYGNTGIINGAIGTRCTELEEERTLKEYGVVYPYTYKKQELNTNNVGIYFE